MNLDISLLSIFGTKRGIIKIYQNETPEMRIIQREKIRKPARDIMNCTIPHETSDDE